MHYKCKCRLIQTPFIRTAEYDLIKRKACPDPADSDPLPTSSCPHRGHE